MLQTMNGYLDGNGSSSYAAHADHVHEDMPLNASTVKAAKKSIAVADWTSKAAEVAFTEGTYLGYLVDAGSLSAATAAALVFTSKGTNKITFGCTTTPESKIDVYILYL